MNGSRRSHGPTRDQDRLYCTPRPTGAGRRKSDPPYLTGAHADYQYLRSGHYLLKTPDHLTDREAALNRPWERAVPRGVRERCAWRNPHGARASGWPPTAIDNARIILLNGVVARTGVRPARLARGG